MFCSDVRPGGWRASLMDGLQVWLQVAISLSSGVKLSSISLLLGNQCGVYVLGNVGCTYGGHFCDFAYGLRVISCALCDGTEEGGGI